MSKKRRQVSLAPREDVRIVTPGGQLTGHLFVGADGLPELLIPERYVGAGLTQWDQTYRPATFPAAWGPIVNAEDERIDGTLLEAWRTIEFVRERLAQAQREAETTEPEEQDNA